MTGETLTTITAAQEAAGQMSVAQRRAIAAAPVSQLALTQFTLHPDGHWERVVLQEASYPYELG